MNEYLLSHLKVENRAFAVGDGIKTKKNLRLGCKNRNRRKLRRRVKRRASKLTFRACIKDVKLWAGFRTGLKPRP